MENNKIIEMYIQNMKVEDKSELTIDNYVRQVEEMQEIVGKSYIDITIADLKLVWLAELQARENSNQTINLKIAAVKSLYNALEELEVIDKNPASKLKTLKVTDVKEKDVWSVEEVKKLIEVSKNVKEKAIVSVLLTTGMRIAELINLTVEDFKKGEVAITVKGNKKRTIYFNDGCKSLVEDYLKVRKESEHNNLFLSTHNSPLRADNTSSTLKKLAKKAGIDKEVCNHSLRHVYISSIAENYGIETARELVCHSSIQTTQRYVHVDKNKIREAALSIEI